MSFHPTHSPLTLDEIDLFYIRASQLVSASYSSSNPQMLKEAIQGTQGEPQQACFSEAIQKELLNTTMAATLSLKAPIETSTFADTAKWAAQASQALNERDSLIVEQSIETHLKSYSEQGILELEAHQLQPILQTLKQAFQHARLGTAIVLEDPLSTRHRPGDFVTSSSPKINLKP